MYRIRFYITIGNYSLRMLEKVTVNRSVQNLADTAVITTPGTAYNEALNIEDKITAGDPVVIRLGYDAEDQDLPVEFEGYVSGIEAKDNSLVISCEDEIRSLRRGLGNMTFRNATMKDIATHVVDEIGGLELDCDYDFKYDKFTIHNNTALDVFKKLKEETKGHFYFEGKTLHIHRKYTRQRNTVTYDFARNIEKSALVYKEDSQAEEVLVEGEQADSSQVMSEAGNKGGNMTAEKKLAVSDKASLEAVAQEIRLEKTYTGYDGNITTWLLPFIRPNDVAELRDDDYQIKTGKFHILAVETTISKEGGSRVVTLGKEKE